MELYYGSTAVGLEDSLIQELKSLEGNGETKIIRPSIFRGGIVFSTSLAPQDICGLRSLDSIFAFLDIRDDVPHAKEAALEYFISLAEKIDWQPALRIFKKWQQVENCDASQAAGSSDVDPNKDARIPNSKDEPEINFRATCHRQCHLTGKHGFTSAEAAGHIGHGIDKKFGWKANMRTYTLEVEAWILDGKILLAIPLIYFLKQSEEQAEPPGQLSTQQADPPNVKRVRLNDSECSKPGAPSGGVVQARSHHADRQLYTRRPYRVSLVRTALKPSTAYSLLQFADISTGHIILDPLCGGGTIPLEASDWLGSRIVSLAGDNNADAVEAAGVNSKAGFGSMGGSDVARWDATRLPIRSGSVDRVVSDMPFGVRCGSVRVREAMSPKVACEIVRILRPETGLAVLMAQSKSLTESFLSMASAGLVVVISEHIRVEMEGIRVGVIVVRRTSKEVPPEPPGRKGRK